MSLEEQIKLEEEELKKLEGNNEDDGNEEDADGEGQDEDQEGDAGEGTDDGDDAGDNEEDADGEDQDDGTKGGEDLDEGKEDDAEDKKASENSLAAQLRIANKHNKQMEARIDELTKPQQQPTPPVNAGEDKGEGDAKAPTAEERLDAIEQKEQESQNYSAAVEEFSQYEKDFEQATPDYKEASTHMINTMIGSFRNLHPTATDAQAHQFIQNQVLGIASKAVQRGINPAEALYSLAHERFGYTAKANKAPPAKVDPNKKLDTVRKNKRRSASPLNSGGQNGSPSATMEEAANMDLGDFSKLTEVEFDQMMNDLQN